MDESSIENLYKKITCNESRDMTIERFKQATDELKQNLINQIDICIKEIEDLHPYKELGNRESYSQYNEGWSDACDILSQKIKQKIEKLLTCCKA